MTKFLDGISYVESNASESQFKDDISVASSYLFRLANLKTAENFRAQPKPEEMDPD